MNIQISEEIIFLLYHSLEIKIDILVPTYEYRVKSVFVTVTIHLPH